MNWWPIIIALIVVFVVVEPIAILWAVMRFGWRPFAEDFPAQHVDEHAVRKRFQSFRLGLLNLGFSIHVAVDERHLHLEPAAWMRRLGARAVSIPWDSISVVKRSRTGAWMTARIGKHTLMGPTWCLELAEPAEPSGARDEKTAERA